MARVQTKRGLRANVPTSGILPGEQFWTTDRQALLVGMDATTTAPVVPPIDELDAIGAVSGAEDLLIIHDASDVMEKRISFDDFKTALNIPDGGEDEKVAVVAGGTAGYLWGTDGTDGVLRMSSSMSWAKDGANAFVTLAVGVVDCGTF